jgi:hypothetical protein
MTSASQGTRHAYQPPTQSSLGQWIDAGVLLLLVFGALYAPVLLHWTSRAATTEVIEHPTWASLHQNPTMVAQWKKLGYTPEKAAPLISSRFDYHVDPLGLGVTALVLIGYFCFVVAISDREYREVIEEKFGPRQDQDE